MANGFDYSNDGLFQWGAGHIPAGRNPKVFSVRSEFVHGGPQIFPDVDSLVSFHPKMMKKGMVATIINFPQPGTDAKYKLDADPDQLFDAITEESLITSENWTDYWVLDSETQQSTQRVYQYAPDFNGGKPPFPYSTNEGLAFESSWKPALNTSANHKWLRFRDSDEFVEYEWPVASGIFIKIYNWSVPVPIGNQYETGDFIDYRFKRENIADAPVTDPLNLVSDGFYNVEEGSVEETLPDGRIFNYASGAYFKAKSANVYQFAANTTVQRVVDIPPRSLPDGKPNNEPSGWTDGIPAGTDQLWRIFAQKSIYGQLKSAWILEKITENPEYVRYSAKSTPNPNSLMTVNDSIGDVDPANSPDTFDDTLTNNGWLPAFDPDNAIFIATRDDAAQGVPGPPFTQWRVDKITDESGEYTDRVYKLFPLNIDFDDVVLDKPVGRDPSDQGWNDAPLPETDTEVNYESQARKFLDGTLKTDWSDPRPYIKRHISGCNKTPGG